jgi:hypothetical protein
MAGLVLLALLPGSAMALVPGDLDQHSELVPHSLGSTTDQAQTFTAGKTGSLNDVELYFNGSGTITVTIQSTSGGLPTGTVLATTTATPGSGAAWIDFAFASPASVTSGVMYAIVFNTGVAAAVWGTGVDDPDNYGPGQALRNNGVWGASTFIGDFAFRTYVSAAGATPTATATATPVPDSAPTASSNVTPPPTATGDLGAPGEPGSLMLLCAGLVAFCGVMLAVLTARRRRIVRA